MAPISIPWLLLEPFLLVLTLISYAISSDLLSAPIAWGLRGLVPDLLLRLVWHLPGTLVHELSHAAFAVLFGHKITDIGCLLHADENGKLGWVKHSWDDRSAFQRLGNVFIGLGPCIGGPLFCWGCHQLALAAPHSPVVVLLCYWLLFAGGSGFRLSPADMYNTTHAGFTGLAICLGAYGVLAAFLAKEVSGVFLGILYKLLLARACLSLLVMLFALAAGRSMSTVGWGSWQVMLVFAQPVIYLWWRLHLGRRKQLLSIALHLSPGMLDSGQLKEIISIGLAVAIGCALLWLLLKYTQRHKIWPEMLGEDVMSSLEPPSLPLLYLLLLLFLSCLLLLGACALSSSLLQPCLTLLGLCVLLTQEPAALNADEFSFAGSHVAAKYRALALACCAGPVWGLCAAWLSPDNCDWKTLLIWAALLFCLLLLACLPPLHKYYAAYEDDIKTWLHEHAS
eukprot:g64845.t1